jgi:polyketide cyclase/dehydrase/lipid transport protein
VKPVVVTLDTELPGPPSVVWALITDWEAQGEWMLEASDFVVVTPHREGVSVEAEATIRIGGIRTRDRIRVDVWEPERALGIVHLGWVAGRGDLSLEATPDGTRFRWREELHPPLGVLGAIGLRVFRPFLVRTFRRDLRILAEIVGRRAGGPVR